MHIEFHVTVMYDLSVDQYDKDTSKFIIEINLYKYLC